MKKPTKCPTCGGPIKFSKITRDWTCPKCRNVIKFIITLLLLIPSPAFALIWEPNFTGRASEKFDYGFYIGHTAPRYIGGPVANNSLGGAWQFTVAEPVKLSYLKVSGTAFNWGNTNGDLDISFKIYDQTRNHEHWGIGPEVTSPLFVSNPWHVDVSENTTFLNEERIDFSVELPSGEYWFAQERGFSDSGPIVRPNVEFYTQEESDLAAAVHAPEPATFALLGLGLPYFFRRKA